MSLLSAVVLSSVVFSGLILGLVGILFFVESKISSKGRARIAINDQDPPLETSTGKTLLAVLSENGVFLASACGGKGTCGECQCIVVEGGGAPLHTETGILSRRQQKQGYRLACQCRVRNNMKLDLPPDVFAVRKYQCTVQSNRNVATFIKELVLELTEPLVFQPGAYIQVHVPPYQARYQDFDIAEDFAQDWEKQGLRGLTAESEEEVARAYSIANPPADNAKILLNVRIAVPPPGKRNLPPGAASSYLFGLRPGAPVTISGPYGDFLIKGTNREMLYIGGGAGMAPLRSHLRHLFETVKTQRKVSYWYGARSRREIFYEEEFRALEQAFPNFSFHVALSEPFEEDHWQGHSGFIHQVVYEQYLKAHAEPEEIEYYLCGPPVMIAAVKHVLESLGVPEEMVMFDDFGEA